MIGAPAGQVRFVCPECQAQTAVLKAGAFDCSRCQTAYVATVGAVTPMYHRFVIRGSMPREGEPAEVQR